jgi:hypothetical protein
MICATAVMILCWVDMWLYGGEHRILMGPRNRWLHDREHLSTVPFMISVGMYSSRKILEAVNIVDLNRLKYELQGP